MNRNLDRDRSKNMCTQHDPFQHSTLINAFIQICRISKSTSRPLWSIFPIKLLKKQIRMIKHANVKILGLFPNLYLRCNLLSVSSVLHQMKFGWRDSTCCTMITLGALSRCVVEAMMGAAIMHPHFYAI